MTEHDDTEPRILLEDGSVLLLESGEALLNEEAENDGR